MSRDDLRALTPESLAALCNLGLVKRAQRELAAGEGPAIEEDAQGVVTGRFKDGVVARLVPGKALKDTPCSCGAATVCRHRVAVALAYREAAPAAAALPEWSPGEVDDTALERLVGKRGMDRARAALRDGAIVEVARGIEGDPPGARLATCTVRFLVPKDLAYARCDCAAQTACEHVVLAAWAFREARFPDGARACTVSLGGARAADAGALAQALDLARFVVATGVANVGPDAAPRFARARAALTAAGLVWPLTLVDDLEEALELYHRKSARYRARDVATYAAEIAARARASVAATAELPARFVLGEGEASETLLDHVRLVSLGARVSADGRTRSAEIYFADPDSAVVLVLAKTWTFEEGEAPEDAPALARRAMAARVGLGALAHGQVVSRVVRRRANRSFTLAASRAGQTSITPQTGAWGELPPSLVVRDVAAWLDEERRAPPKLLRPRVLADGLKVLAVTAVTSVVYVASEQQLVAEVRDEADNPVLVTTAHRAVAPHALDAVASALLSGGVRFVSGELARGAHGAEIDPVGLVVGDRVIVPDLAAEKTAWDAPRVERQAHASPIAAALGEAASLLEEVAHLGVRATQGLGPRLEAAAGRLEDAGLSSVAKRYRALGARVGAAGSEAGRAAAVDAWVDAGIRTRLAEEG